MPLRAVRRSGHVATFGNAARPHDRREAFTAAWGLNAPRRAADGGESPETGKCQSEQPAKGRCRQRDGIRTHRSRGCMRPSWVGRNAPKMPHEFIAEPVGNEFEMLPVPVLISLEKQRGRCDR